jgi:N-acetylglucosaminyldiphosphoundecaprenol N-acetyl-beta-D-mannosaminyltransferase
MSSRISAFGIQIDAVSMEQAVNRVLAWINSTDKVCRYIVTPNVDHVVRLQNSNKFHAAYEAASLVLTDGKPIFFSLRLLGNGVPETVPGSDFVPRLFDASRGKKGLKVFWLGAAPGVAEKAANRVKSAWPHIDSVGCYSPPFGFEGDEQENRKILRLVKQGNPDILIIGLGAPKQELWIHAYHNRINGGVALCVGAVIDFLAGEKKRAPLWIRKLSLEWLYRIITEPGRLLKRYLYDAVSFPFIVWKEWRKNGRPDLMP